MTDYPLTTYEYLEGQKRLDKYIKINKQTQQELRMPLSITDKYRSIFSLRRFQMSNYTFVANVGETIITCYDDAISGPCIKGIDGTILSDVSSYWAESMHYYKGKPLIVNEPSVVIANKWGGWNYFHFLHTCLPKLGLASFGTFEANKLGLFPFDKIIINNNVRPFINEYFNLLGYDKEQIVILSKNPCINCKQTIVTSLIGYGVNPDKQSCDLLRKMFLKYFENGEDKIYVKRDGFRKIINEEILLKGLVKNGFKIIDPVKMTVEEQIRQFSKASVVISAHGAGLSNIVWCKPGTKILEIFSPTYVGLCYWLLADSSNLEYYYLIGEGDFDEVSDYWYSDGKKDIKVNLDEFVRILKLMEII